MFLSACAGFIAGMSSKPAIIKADTAAFGKLVKGGGDLVGHGKEMGSRLGRQVVPAVGFLARYDQQVPPGYWLDVHEGHAFAVASDEAAGAGG